MNERKAIVKRRPTPLTLELPPKVAEEISISKVARVGRRFAVF